MLFFACRPSAHHDAAAQPTSQGRRSSLIVMQSEGRSGAAGDLAQERQAAGGHAARQVPGHRLRAPRGRCAASNRAGARRQGRSQLRVRRHERRRRRRHRRGRPLSLRM